MGLEWSKVSDEEKQYPLHEITPWPDTDGAEAFKAFMLNHYELMHNLGVKLMRHIAEGFGKPVNFFDKWFVQNTCSTFRLIRYLPRSTGLVSQQDLREEDLKFTTPIHTDSGFLTLLSTFSYPGH